MKIYCRKKEAKSASARVGEGWEKGGNLGWHMWEYNDNKKYYETYSHENQ